MGDEFIILFSKGVVQYSRTNHIKQTRFIMDRERFRLYLRIANPLAHMVALNVGLSLYAERKQHKIILIDNPTDLPFITADQPVINMAASPKETRPPEKFELYYPLSPTRAMLLLEPSSIFLPGDSSVPRRMAIFVLYQSRSNGRSCHVRESRTEGERRQARDDDAKPRIRPGRVVQGFCRNPLLDGLKGGEKSSVGNLAGSTQ